MLSGDNGILQRATDAKENTGKAQIQEQINLAYHSALVDGQGKVTETSLENELKKEFNKTSLEEGWLDKTSIDGKWKITIDDISLNVPAGTTDIPKSVISYGGKTAETLNFGDDIIIGTTEKFMVLKKSTDNKTITALPYYNLKLDSNPIKQATEETKESAGMVPFSSVTTPTWNGNKDIDLDIHENNLKQFVTKYQKTLEDIGTNNVTVAIATNRK